METLKIGIMRVEKAEIQEIINADLLTGVGNRRNFNLMIEELWEQGQPFSIAYIDIDKLKLCNDTYSHAEGDRYICSVCACLKQVCQEGESLFRIGGDEFLLLSKIDDAAALSSRLVKARRTYVEERKTQTEYPCNFSFGCVDASEKSGLC